MDDFLLDNPIPDYDALDDWLTRAAPSQAQTKLSEPRRRAAERDFDSMLDSILLDLGEYESVADGLDTPTDDAPVQEDDVVPEAAEEAPSRPPEDSDAAPVNDDGGASVILGADEAPEEEPEPELAFLRRMARRHARRAEREDDAPHSPEANAPDEEDELYELDSEIAEELDAFSAPSRPAFVEKLRAPLLRLMAIRKARQNLREQEAAAWPTPVDIRQTPELSARKACKYYEAQVNVLGTRLYILLFLTLVQAWIALRFPLAGLLRQNVPMQSAVSLVFLLTSMLCALDVLTTGLLQLIRFQPSMEALSAVSCLFACLDSLLTTLGVGSSLPYCALASASLCAALWGEKLLCQAQTVNLSTAAQDKSGSVLSAETDDTGLDALVRSERDPIGIVRRSEEPDGAQNVYAVAALPLLILSFALGILSTIGQPWTGAFHHLSAYFSVCANISCFLCFSLPYLAGVLALRRSGSAIAGWAGCAEIGRTRRIIIKDTDLFPPGTLSLAFIHIPDNALKEKVVSYAASVLNASGSSVASAFSALMEKRKYTLLTVSDFKCHDGGGFSAYIHNENVLLGSRGFLNLMGIRLPPNLSAENAIYIAISNEVVGMFEFAYTPIKGVRVALDLLLQGRTLPVFAIRDFNITPLMIKNLFRLPSINFEFPSFRERFRLSSCFGSGETPPAAVLLRSNVRCAVETADRGRRLYTACTTSTALSLASAVLGMLLVFLNLRSGNLAAASAGRMLLYNFIWAFVPLGFAYWTLR